MSVSAKDILKSELQEGEELLWSHVISQGTEIVPPAYVIGIWKFAQPIIFTLYLFSLLYWLKEIPSEELGDMLKQQFPIWIAFGIILYLFTKTVIGKKLQSVTKRPIFRNAMITDQRILFFNQDSDERREFTKDGIVSAALDYENGGRCLSVEPSKKNKTAILIGIIDFEVPLNIIKSHFLKTGLSS